MRHDYQAAFPGLSDKLKFFIGDVRDLQSVKNAMYGVDYIFHAAALKQVPSCEFFPMEAVKTNVIGTDNVLTAAISEGVKSVICLSTDKAAYPVNAMGTSKAMMEKVIVAKSRTVSPERTKICCTRYGNVLCSRGSVVPLWIEQIKAGKPITITDPNMTRFIMSLDEAVDLVLFAFENGTSGDILVQKAPACTIGTLAEAVKELFKSKDDIKVIGIRHGEKMYETLLTNEECSGAIDLGSFYRVPSVSPWLMKRAKQSPILSDKNHYVILNGIDTENVFHPRTSKLRKELGLENKKVVVHVTASFTREIKGGKYVIELAKAMPEVVFIVIGNTDKGLSLPNNIIDIGRTENQTELAEYYSIADAFLLTSQKETFCMPVAESLCCGTPVVGFKAGAPEEIAIPEFSAFVDFGDTVGLQAGLEKVLKKTANHEDISEKAIAKYSKHIMAEGYLSVYGDVYIPESKSKRLK
jgi:UDP-N-acetylglucosamine 4,6-dehydratase